MKELAEIVDKVLEAGRSQGKATGFLIGNTTKGHTAESYFIPIRETAIMVFGGAIVYSETQAMAIAEALDGRVDYILVDAEKKLPSDRSLDGAEPANIERRVREIVKRSTLWIYKANDLTVHAIDYFLAHLHKDVLRGVGGKKVAILGAGNIGCKLALVLVERGANVVLTRRDNRKLDTIIEALNIIKPISTLAQVTGTTDNEAAAAGADILIGATPGTPVVTAQIVNRLAPNAVIVDVAKGALYPDAISVAEQRQLDIYRLDVSAAIEGLIQTLWSTEKNMLERCGRRDLHGEHMVSGGILGRYGELVVDNVWDPSQVYGIADGCGDFIRELSAVQQERLLKIQTLFE